MIAKVIVNVSSSNTDQYYDYIVPTEFISFAKIGSRVKVPFGNADRIIMGFILELYENTNNNDSLKEIIEVIDYEPVITSNQIEIAKYIKNDAVCPLIRILNLMIPDGLKLKTKKYLTLLDYQEIDPRLIALFGKNETIEYNSSLKEYDYLIAKYVKYNKIKISYDSKQVTKEKYVNKYMLNPGFTYQNFSQLRSLRQREFLENLHNEIALTANELVDKYEVSLSMINSLYKKGYLSKIEEIETRIKQRNIPFEKRIKASKDDLIIKLLERVNNYVKPILFIPINFKQQVAAILQIINKNLEQGKNTIIFVPEILNTYKIDNYIRKETGLSVGVINSTMSSGEILDIYNEIINNTYSVIVTSSKGALFPFKNVGSYLLLDSESDNYYNDQSPRYDLHKVFEYSAGLTNSKVIRMSFIPTVLEYTYGLKGHLDIIENIELNKSVNTEIIDLKDELKFGHNSYLSVRLLKLIQINKAKNKRSILIVNNKGYSSYVLCRSCGETIKCPRCSISMQYNKKNEMLICPACANRKPFENKCPICLTNTLKLGGVGIEQVEEELKKELPSLNIVSYVSNNFDDFLNLQEDIYENNVDLLITTSLHAKSIVMENIGLVAIINIDSTLKAADYDATYRAYNLINSMGRIVEANNDSLLVVQTYNPNEQYLKDYLTGNYHDFIKNEVVIRKILKNEPFYFVNRIIVKGKYETIFKDAQAIKQMLSEQYGKEVFIMGPTYNYQFAAVQLIIKHKINNISDFYQIIYQKYQSTSTTILIDKYPKYL